MKTTLKPLEPKAGFNSRGEPYGSYEYIKEVRQPFNPELIEVVAEVYPAKEIFPGDASLEDALNFERLLASYPPAKLNHLLSRANFMDQKLRQDRADDIQFNGNAMVAMRWIANQKRQMAMQGMHDLLKIDQAEAVLLELAKDKTLNPMQKIMVIRIVDHLNKTLLTNEGIVSRLVDDRPKFKETFRNALIAAEDDDNDETIDLLNLRQVQPRF